MLFFYIVGTFITLGLFALDKSQALVNKWRVPESVLLLFTFFFGTFGAALGMLIFRHKTAKRSFLLKFFIIVFIQLILVYVISTAE